MERLRVLITVKTYPIPSKAHDELVCTAGIAEDGRNIRLYPVNFRDLPFSQQYKKYQWIEVDAERHTGRDARKESYRPNCDTLIAGDVVPPGSSGLWEERRKLVLRDPARSMEDLYERKDKDRTSLGIFKPAEVFDVVATPDEREWKPAFLENLKQARLWDDRTVTQTPPRKLPFKFRYHFRCDDDRCSGRHKMMIEDWELGALYWRMIDKGCTPKEACESVREKFLGEICAPGRETWFYVGTVLAHGTWVVIGVFWPRVPEVNPQLSLFE